MNQFEQGLLKYLSVEQLKQIQSKHIGIAGCGGLGSNAALILARSGFKTFTLLDHDTIDTSNLNRQQYALNDIGKVKCQCLAEKISAINPGAQSITHNIKWDQALRNDPFASCDILLEAFDQAETKSALIDHCHDKVDYIISGNGMAGIGGPPLAITRCGNIIIVGDNTSDTDKNQPPLAPRVTQCAAIMAQQVLELTLNNL